MTGRVTLLGAGPGNPELLTLLGKRRLQEADVVLYDRLINPSLLAFMRADAERVDVGKLPRFHKVKQSVINQLLVDYARDGKQVVRLKAGDPYVFGRGGEEGQFLHQHRVKFEIVPGLTSAITGLAAVGIPITHRDYASSFHVITGHHQADGQQLDWPNIAHQEGTLVFLMGMAALEEICTQLVANGRTASTPVAIIQWATQWRQQMVTGTLANIVERATAKKIGAPALIVVGNVVTLTQALQPELSLQGTHVLLPYSASSRLFTKLQDRGATADFYERATSRPLAVTLPDWQSYQELLVLDSQAYDALLTAMVDQGQDQRQLARLSFTAANQAVAKRLRRRGIIVDAVQSTAATTGKTLAIGEANQSNTGENFLATYRAIVRSTAISWPLEQFQAIIFPSSASVHDFVATLTDTQRQQMPHCTVIAMGIQVARALRQAGITQPIVQAKTINDVIDQLESRRVSHDENSNLNS